MKRKLFTATALYGAMIFLLAGTVFTACTKDYDDDLRIQRELIENNEKELRATIDAYQTQVDNLLAQMEQAYKHADAEQQIEIDAAKAKLVELEQALKIAENNISALSSSFEAFKVAVEADFNLVNQQIQAINTRIDGVDKKIDGIDSRLKSVEAAIEGLEDFRDAAIKEIEMMKKAQDASDAAIKELEKRVAAIDNLIATLQAQYENLADIVAQQGENLTDKINDLNANLTGKINDLNTNFGLQITTLTSTLTEQITQLSVALGQLETRTQENLNAAKAELNSAITNTKNDLQREMDAFKTEVNGKLAEVAGEITTIGRDVNELASGMGELYDDYNDLLEQITGVKGDFAGLSQRIDALTVELAKKAAELNVLIDANKTNNAENKAAIRELETEMQGIANQVTQMQTSLEEQIAQAVADKVTRTEFEQLDEDYKAADAALRELIDTIDNETIPALQADLTALEGRMDNVEQAVAALQNRIQAIRWVPAYEDGYLTLAAAKNVGGSAYDSAVVTEEVYIVCNDAEIIAKITAADSPYTVEVVTNEVQTRALVASPFGKPAVSAGSTANTLKIELAYTDLATLWTDFSAAVGVTPVKLQLALKISDDKGNTAMTDFMNVAIENN